MDARRARKTPPPAAPASCRLLLRVYAAEGLRGVSSHGTYCKVYVGGADMAASRKGRQSLKNFLLADASDASSSHSTSSSSSSSSSGSAVREFKTQVHKFSRASPVWNEKFEVPHVDAARDLVSIRVKSARIMSSPAVGACCLPLRDVPEDETVDRWLELLDGKKPAGRVRVQVRLTRAEEAGSTDPADAAAMLRGTRRSAKRSSSSSSLSRTRLSGSMSPVASDQPPQQPPASPSKPTSGRRKSGRKEPESSANAGDELGHGSETSTSSSSSFSSRSDERPTGTPSHLASRSTEFTDDDRDVAAAMAATGSASLSSYGSFVLSRDRATMLSDISSAYSRGTGSFVGSLHLYNRNSIATSTPTRTTVVLSEAEIAALTSETTQRRPHSSMDGDTESDDEDDEEPETEGPRIPWNSTITRLLTRKSTNIVFDEDDDEDDDVDRPSELLEIVPIMDFPGTPHDIDIIDCA